MRKNLFTIAAAAMSLVVGLSVMPMTALAAAQKTDTENLSIKLPVSVALEGSDLPSPAEDFTITLAATNGAPAQEKTQVVISGAGSDEFDLNFQTVGIYTYTITQTPGTNERGTYDDTVYYLRVSAVNNDSGAYTVYAAAHTDEAMQSEKPDSITFTNSYRAIPQPTPEPTLTPDPDPSPEPSPDAPDTPTPPAVTPQAPVDEGAVQGAAREAAVAAPEDDGAVQGANRHRAANDEEPGSVLGAIRNAATGDNGALFVYGCVIVAAVVALGIWFVIGKRKKGKK